MGRLVGLIAAAGLLAAVLVTGAAAVKGPPSTKHPPTHTARLTGEPLGRSGQYSGGNFGTHITECPQAKLPPNVPRALDRRDKDQLERISERGDDKRANYDQACVPENETSIAINPNDRRNLVAGANDYQGDYNAFYATPTRGNTWYGSVNLNPSNPFAYNLTQSDPVFVYDRDGVAYNQEIAFAFDDSNGVFVWRSTNGGFTWSRPCVPIDTTEDPSDEAAVCGGPGNVTQPGDGVITFNQDPTPGVFDGDAPFDDKNWMAAGPRPSGVSPVCFTPLNRTPTACNPAVVGSDRLHATWTRFDLDGTARIMHSFSDDQARSWSPARPISGTAAFCAFGTAAPTDCDQNQFSVPTVHPSTGLVGVAYENFNTPGENQYLFVRSSDGGATWQGPFHITMVFDVNYPSGATRPDCRARGQAASREVLTNSCFRVNSAGNVVVDKRGGSFADDFYLVMSDNRSGTPASSNTDVFFFRSTDGGSSWVGPTRVNDDRSVAPPNRDAATMGNFGNDQWFPWIDVNEKGVLAVSFYDRRLDEDSVAHPWPTSRQRPGNFLGWRWGAGCKVERTPSRECVAPDAAVIPQPTAPQNPGSGPVPGQGAGYLGSFANQVLQDVPSNYDYAFRAGLFIGDYDQTAYPNFPDQHGKRGDDGDRGDDDESSSRLAVAVWTDARNGRGSGAPTTLQSGRNPGCEQSDVFLDFFNPLRRDTRDAVSEEEERLFLVAACPGDSGGGGGDDDDD
jgi:hypothetical protein